MATLIKASAHARLSSGESKGEIPVVRRWLHRPPETLNTVTRRLPTESELAKLSGTGPLILPEELHPRETCFVCKKALPLADWKGVRLFCCGVRVHHACNGETSRTICQRNYSNLPCPLCNQTEVKDYNFIDKVHEWANPPDAKRFALCYLGETHCQGLGDVAADLQEAFLFFNDAVVKTNCPVATFRLAELCDRVGRGNERKGFESCKLAAESNLPEAMHRLASYYEAGYGCEQNFQKLGEWMLLAARHGHVPSQTQMGCIHRNGQLGVQDIAQSIYWFEHAGMIGNDLEALYRLGTVYAAPIGETVYNQYTDPQKAAQCYRQAAERGHPLACREWGKFLIKGLGGVAVNPGVAWRWYLKASKAGVPDAIGFQKTSSEHECWECGQMSCNHVLCSNCGGAFYCNDRCRSKNFLQHKIPCMIYQKWKSENGRGGTLEQYLKWELLDWTDSTSPYLHVGVKEPTLTLICCSGCNKPEANDVQMKSCVCGTVQYCNEKCRKKSWNKHKKICRRLLKAAKNRKKNPNRFI